MQVRRVGLIRACGGQLRTTGGVVRAQHLGLILDNLLCVVLWRDAQQHFRQMLPQHLVERLHIMGIGQDHNAAVRLGNEHRERAEAWGCAVVPDNLVALAALGDPIEGIAGVGDQVGRRRQPLRFSGHRGVQALVQAWLNDLRPVHLGKQLWRQQPLAVECAIADLELDVVRHLGHTGIDRSGRRRACE